MKELVRRWLLGTPEGDRLHVGCGPLALPGWINIDNQPYPGVDQVVDVRGGLPFENLRFVFAEHFIEHLSYEDGSAFMRECRRILRDDGVLRLSTPNLDWVWMTHYHFGSWPDEALPVADCFAINKAFRAWGHQFLYNLQTLTATLQRAGFARIDSRAYGMSDHAELRGLERHEQYPDSPELPHIIIVEASGRGDGRAALLDQPLADFRQAMAAK